MDSCPCLLTRRALLGATGAAGTAAALSACAPSGGGSPAGQTPGPIPTGGTPVRVGKVSDVAVGSTAAGSANGKDVLIYRPEEASVLAYSAVCPHAGCVVAPAGQEFHCPCHGSIFQPSDGGVQTGPARKPLSRLAAAIDGEWITVSV
ncbi:Rieske (2Fe-2S) protein [Paenarthrobacter sp. Z7-10]|uniref:QcrA and Rieske domain-containing protein n=1 Tax=Paenarthrobacter sp. Z7-10 TaxID=2787635 RepID=UPI0022A90F08|nr:Rieske (2Fe-2S) protein [Paenarthrobacter sp. Z7-10]MCZ2405022.1 Rieske (2Fe-2S) protein [Paenarthrobacter sp. Z7-10]